MSLDTFIPSESPESSGNSAEVAEQLREAIKRGAAGVKRTQKDEKKAKKYDMLLAGFLVKIIIDKKFDFILETLFKALDKGFSSNLVLGVISLIHEEISEKIKSLSGKNYSNFDFKYSQQVVFNPNNIDTQIQNRINSWVEDITDIVVLEYSHIQIEELKKSFLAHDHLINQLATEVFGFFLTQTNISFEKKQIELISEFIMKEIFNEVNKLKIELV